MASNRRLRFRLSNVISRVLLINLRRACRVKPRKLSSLHPLESATLINPGKNKLPRGRMMCCSQEEAAVQENCHRVLPPQQAPPKLPPKVCPSPDTWERHKVWNVVAQVDNRLVRKRVVLKKKRSRNSPSPSSSPPSQPPEPEAGRGAGGSGSSTTFRLSTSSGDASMGTESLSWDREHSLFTSDDSSAAGSARLQHVTFSEVDEVKLRTRRSKGGGHFTSPVSCCGRSLPDLGYSNSRRRASLHKQEEVSLLRNQTQTLHALESSSKVWQTGGGTSRNVRSSGAAMKPPRNKQSLPSAVRGKVRESFPVHVVSSDPYSDFRQSMMQMIYEKKLNRNSDLEELLECYLYLNPPGFHEVIVQVFTDLWLEVGGAEGAGEGGGRGESETVNRKHAWRSV